MNGAGAALDVGSPLPSLTSYLAVLPTAAVLLRCTNGTTTTDVSRPDLEDSFYDVRMVFCNPPCKALGAMADDLIHAVYSHLSSKEHTSENTWSLHVASQDWTAVTVPGPSPAEEDGKWLVLTVSTQTAAQQLPESEITAVASANAAVSASLDHPDPTAVKNVPNDSLTRFEKDDLTARGAEEEDHWKKIPRLASSLTGGGATGALLRSIPWSTGALGPIHTWPQSLITSVSLMMSSSFPMGIWWGPEFVLIYNDAYKPIAAAKHPYIFGKPGAEAWSEIWDTLEPLALRVMQGENCYSEDHLLFMIRNGFPEETYHTWSYVPIRQEDGSVGGLLNPTFETTGRVVSERRLKTLREYSARAATARSVKELCAITGEVLSSNPFDIPFAMMYLVSVDTTDQTSLSEPSAAKVYKLDLAVHAGITLPHPAAPASVSIDTSLPPDEQDPDARMWPFWQVLTSHQSVEVRNEGRVDGIPGRGWDEPSRTVVVCPIDVGNEKDVLGILVWGISSRRPYDDDHKTVVELLRRQIGTSLFSVKSLEEELQRAEALAALDRAKTAFFSSVSHELRTPLTLILGPLAELLSASLPPAQHSKLQLINRNSQRLLKLVNSLLDFSRLEAGRMAAAYRSTDLSRFTEDLASVFRAAIEKGGIAFTVTAVPTKNVWVDRDMYEKIIFNLLGNAFKYTLGGSITVSVSEAPGKDGVLVQVSDTGAGIPEAEHSKVFERFHRVEGMKGRSHEGTGIGLSLTRELVEMHHGRITVDSEPGLGSTFSVFMPYGTSHLPSERLVDYEDEDGESKGLTYGMLMVEEATRWLPDEESTSVAGSESAESSSGSSTYASTAGSRILLADDNSDMRRYVRGLLERWWRVTDVPDGRAAWEALKNGPDTFDLVITDIMMPGVNGFELLKLVRSGDSTRNLPVMLLSARAGEESRVDGLEAGADDYLVKPFSGKELVARVHTHLELGKLRAELERRVNQRTKALYESEWRYKALAQLSPVGIFRMDERRRVVYANERWWEVTMLQKAMADEASEERGRHSTIRGEDVLETVYWEDRESYWQHLVGASTIQSGTDSDSIHPTTSTCEVRFHDPSTNTTKWALSTVLPCPPYSSHSMPRSSNIGIIGTLTDITDTKRLEADRLRALALAESQQRKRAEEAEEVKRQQELFIDMTCHELRNPLNGIFGNLEILWEGLEKERGEVGWLQERNEYERDRKQRALMRQQQEEQEQRERDALSLSDSVHKVTAWLSENIATNLEAVSTISLCAKHQKAIADDVLNISKISMNLLTLHPIVFSPLDTLREVVKMFEGECRKKDVLLVLEIEPSYAEHIASNKVVVGDKTRLKQVAINFLTNAVRFVENTEGERRVCVRVGAGRGPLETDGRHTVGHAQTRSERERDRKSLGMEWGMRRTPSPSSSNTSKTSDTLTPKSHLPDHAESIFLHTHVIDTGLGMTPQEQSQLFKRFTKTHAEFGGSGLGLFISKRLVEMQGGGIQCWSEPGKGTEFGFWVQYELRDAAAPGVATVVQTIPEEDDVSTPTQQRHAASSSSVAFTEVTVTSAPAATKSLNVLVVEDNQVNQKVLRKLLESLGHSVAVANHGGEALEVLQVTNWRDHTDSPRSSTDTVNGRSTGTFDVVLMDIEMPVMNGLECSQRIRSYEKKLSARSSWSPSADQVDGELSVTDRLFEPLHHSNHNESTTEAVPRIPIIAVTGNARTEYLSKALESGMDDFLVKPYMKKELIRKIAKFME
ncbi:hypothetical protein HDU85_001574 [Gaertneriomyces sp. JEL0708]|nr:hypothetical protein HDU85_001574 [Gaertneriomyces sp. JEL0708]